MRYVRPAAVHVVQAVAFASLMLPGGREPSRVRIPQALAQGVGECGEPTGCGGVSGGGGKGWWLWYPKQKATQTGTLTVSVFVDWNADGNQDDGDRPGFTGVNVDIVGHDVDGAVVARSAVVGIDGTAIVIAPAGRYSIALRDPQSQLRQCRMPMAAETEVQVLAGTTSRWEAGCRPRWLIRYAPCLRIGTGENSIGQTASEALLARLVDASGNRVWTRKPKSALMTREEFLTLLLRTQCIQEQLTGRGGDSAQAVAFQDSANAGGAWDATFLRTLRTLIAAGIPAGRMGPNGVLADGSAPILRREVVAAVAAAIGPGPSGGEPVRIAMDAEPEQRGIHGRLHSFGVLPASFSSTAVGGVTQAEGASILAKAAFIAGRIYVDGNAGSGWRRGELPGYLRRLGTGGTRPCLESDGNRAAAVGFPLAQPDLNDDLWWRLRMLAGVGTRQGGRMQWLLTGKPAEFGVPAGQLNIDARASVTRLGLVRSLLIATCHPLESAADAGQRLTGRYPGAKPGTAAQFAPPDRYAGTKDNAEFMARVFHSAQRPIGEYNLTLFTFAPDLLHGEPRAPNGVVSVEEASRLLASSAVYTRVRLGLLAPDDAEKRSAELAISIQKQFAPGGGKEPLRWRMLIEFLSDVLGPELASAQGDAVPSLGEAWWSVLQLQR